MASGRAPFVPMRTDLVKDERVAFVADVCGCSRDEVLGRLFRLWAWCTDRKLDDAPADCAGYAVHDAVIRRFMGPEGARALLGDGCEALALGDRRPDGLIFLHGTETVVESYRRSRSGGLGRAETARVQGRNGGRFVSAQTNAPATPPAHHQDLPDPDPDQREREGALARSSGVSEPESGARPAIVPPMSPPASPREDKPRTPRMDRIVQSGPSSSPRPPAEYNPEDPAHRGGLAAGIYRRVSEARVAIAAELGLPAQLPFPVIAPSSRAGSFRELLDRVREEGAAAPAACERVVSNLIDQARETKDIEWLAEKAFREGAWRTARGWISKRPKPRPRPVATESHDPDPPLTDDDRAELLAMSQRIAANPVAARAVLDDQRKATP